MLSKVNPSKDFESSLCAIWLDHLVFAHHSERSYLISQKKKKASFTVISKKEEENLHFLQPHLAYVMISHTSPTED